MALPGAGVVAVTDEAGIRPDFLPTWLVMATFWKFTTFRRPIRIRDCDKRNMKVRVAFCWSAVQRFKGILHCCNKLSLNYWKDYFNLG